MSHFGAPTRGATTASILPLPEASPEVVSGALTALAPHGVRSPRAQAPLSWAHGQMTRTPRHQFSETTSAPRPRHDRQKWQILGSPATDYVAGVAAGRRQEFVPLGQLEDRPVSWPAGEATRLRDSLVGQHFTLGERGARDAQPQGWSRIRIPACDGSSGTRAPVNAGLCPSRRTAAGVVSVSRKSAGSKRAGLADTWDRRWTGVILP